MSNKIAWVALLVAAVALAIVLLRPSPATGVPEAKKETAFERVMRTRTIRCAYAMWPPYAMSDPNTGAKSGINHEIMEAIGKVANLKIEWLEEVGFGSFPEQLRNGKEDVLCSGAWMGAPRGQRVEYTSPIEYSVLYAYVREDDSRFDSKLEALNDESATIAVIDGGTTKTAADAVFPRAKQYALPGEVDTSQAVLAVAKGKSDAVIVDDFLISDYNARNPSNKLRRVAGAPPLRTFGVAYAVAKGEWELRDLLSVALSELQLNGTVERIIKKYETTPGSILRVAKPYADPVHGGNP